MLFRSDGGPVDELRAGATLYVHGIYTKDVEAVRHEVLRLEALALHAFGSREDYEQALADVVSHESALTTEDPPEPEA